MEDEECITCHLIYTDHPGTESVEIDTDEIDEFKWVKPEEYKELNWHADSGYSIPAVEKLDKYLN